MTLQVPTASLPLRIVFRDGSSREGEVLLQAVSDDRSGPETLGRRLRRENFIPCRLDGEIVLLNLDHVAYFEYLGRLPEVVSHDEVSGLRISARLQMAHGEELQGDLLSTLPPDQGRALDLLNTLDQRFVLLADSESSRYVQLRAVTRVEN